MEIKINDPIHGEITIEEPFASIIRTKEMQRLKKISQNGFSLYEYPKLEQSNRFNHSIGAFFIMKKIIARIEKALNNYGISIDEEDKTVALTAILLHDIGHGPFSHSFEKVSNYPHEARTADIILGNTEIGRLLNEIYGRKKVTKIASFISNINDHTTKENDSFTKLFKNLVSHQLDADRLDYLMRDAYYTDTHSLIDLQRIIESMNVVVNNNQEYELVINQKGLSCVENVLIQRYQMYRDVYLSKTSVLCDYIFESLIKYIKVNPDTIKKIKELMPLINDSELKDLGQFLVLDEELFKTIFTKLSTNPNKIVSYLSNVECFKDYIEIEPTALKKLQTRLKEMIPDIEPKELLSIAKIDIKSNLYNGKNALNIETGNTIHDISECTNLIKPQSVLSNTFVFFNPILFMLETKLSVEQIKKYKEELMKMIEELNKKPEEFELKYVLDEDASSLDILKAFIDNGFKVISDEQIENDDSYYDTNDSALKKVNGSFRIRTTRKEGQTKYIGTFKMPSNKGEVYSSRIEIEEKLDNDNFIDFIETMQKAETSFDFSKIVPKPLLNSCNNRTNVVLEKNGIRVCLSFDNVIYQLDEIKVDDILIEIEVIGAVTNRVILNEIHAFLTKNFPWLTVTKESKYERGINKIREYKSKTYSKTN